MKQIVMGILAHVDAGKTTLSEAILYQTGVLRKLGRVDNGDTALDTHNLEKERGITIFAGQSVFNHNDCRFTLLDTPGHVDFSAETERILSVLDCAVLVVSGTDGVQSHTRTLWRLLSLYHIPTFIFVTKTDYARRSNEDLLTEIKKELSQGCFDFNAEKKDDEEISLLSEETLNTYLENGSLSDEDYKKLIQSRLLFPCYFGSGLKLLGIDELLNGITRYEASKIYPDSFGARVFKITHDANGNKVTHLKVTGGVLKIRDTVKNGDAEEKISGIRLYSGAKFTSLDEVPSGTVCAVTGLTQTSDGMGLGFEESLGEFYTEPVMSYRLNLPDGVDPKTFLPKLKLLEEEDPQLHISWNTRLQEIHIELMGEVQTEIIKALIAERFAVDAAFDQGTVMYKETVKNSVEGVGHYEPLRHYAEVHLLLEPLPRGKGVEFATKCREDDLDRNWQRLILQNMQEKQHLGVLTGSPLTDVKITLAAGRAHLKHTEGGDFRQATYRAIRQGLMQAENILLEPYYDFRLEVPTEQIGRAISDIKLKGGSFDPPETEGNISILKGTAPVVCLNSYASEVASYTGGTGRLLLTVKGYDICHNPEEVIEKYNYDPEGDLDNSPDSVFCAHGAGFPVKWNEVPQYMHLESCIGKKDDPYTVEVNRRNFHLDDKELEEIMEKEFGKQKLTQTLYRKPQTQSTEEVKFDTEEKKKYIILDGYNVIFAWDELKSVSETSLENARVDLCEIMSNFAAFTKYEIIIVFDAYKVPGNNGKTFDKDNIHIVFTKENETGDTYIEKLAEKIGKNDNVRVVTSDGLIQLSALRYGVVRVSAREFKEEVEKTGKQIRETIESLKREKKTKLKDIFPDLN